MALSERESNLKTKVIALMHQHGKKRYAYDGVEITLAEEETVKVKIKKPKEAEA
jgi:ACT domain-containing protein